MAKKRMQVVVDEVITGQCPDCKVHSGVVAEMKAVCTKMEEKYDRISERMDDRDKMTAIRHESLRESITVAKETMDHRLEGMNQLTHQLDLQRQETKEKMLELVNTFMPKERFDAEHKTFSITIQSKIDSLTKDITQLQLLLETRKEGMRWMEYIATVIISFIVFIISRIIFKF
jgi:hypothetical protein